jgi:uncharacterized membrane protein YoaK (UPF0700 family)
MKHIAEAAVPIAFFVLIVVAASILHERQVPPAPTKIETLSCVRVREVTPAGTINYLCEVRK